MAEALVDAEACSTTMDVTLTQSMPDQMTIQDKESELLVVVQFDDDYLKTAPGLIKFLQVVSGSAKEHAVSQLTNFNVCD